MGREMPPDFPGLKIVGHEMEVRPCRGMWSRFEGRIVALVSPGSGVTHRHHYLPTASRWMRSRSRGRLERRLLDRLDAKTRAERLARAETRRLVETMWGWV